MKNIAFNINGRYSDYCITVMNSVLNYDEDITFHVLHDVTLTEDLKTRIRTLAKTKKSRIVFYLIDESYFKGYPVSEQWPITIYYRIILPEVLPNNLEKVLYVDCDIMFRDRFDDLWDIDLKNYALAAVEDVLSPIAPMYDDIECDTNNGYFNSGVMLINLKYWREHSFTDKTLEYLSANSQKVLHPDQDAINFVASGNWLKLNYRWNFLSSYQNLYFSHEHLNSDFDKISASYPVIVHFSGVKPWNPKCRTRYKYEYYHYAKLSGLENIIPKKRLIDKIENIIVNLLNIIQLKRKRVNFYV